MSTPARYYSSTARETNLTAAVNTSVTTIQVASTTGFPASTPFTISVDYGAVNEELMDVSSVVGLSLTVTRSVDSTSASGHNAGAVVRHVSSARDFRESRAHESSTTNVHGFTPADGEFVGTTATQTLSNKTLDKATGTLRNVDIYNTGTWQTAIIGDSANPGLNRLVIKDNEIGLNNMAEFNSAGALVLRNQGTADNVHRLRALDADGATTRAAIFSGGTLSLQPTASTTFTTIDIIAPDTSSGKRTIRVAASGGGTERFTVWNDGRVGITGTSTSQTPLTVTGAAGQAVSYINILNSSSAVIFNILSNTKGVFNGTLDVRNDINTGGVSTPVLRVFARNPGQTGALTQWLDASGGVVATVSATGAGSFQGLSSGTTLNVTGTTTLGTANITTVNATTVTASGTVTGGTVTDGGTFTSAAVTPSGTITAASGWTITASNMVRRGGWLMYGATLTRTGAALNITASTGNVQDEPPLIVVPAALRPSTLFSNRLLQFTISDGVGSGCWQLNSADGTTSFSTWSPNSSIGTGDAGFRITMMYPID